MYNFFFPMFPGGQHPDEDNASPDDGGVRLEVGEPVAEAEGGDPPPSDRPDDVRGHRQPEDPRLRPPHDEPRPSRFLPQDVQVRTVFKGS